jgi:hypothetical protein
MYHKPIYFAPEGLFNLNAGFETVFALEYGIVAVTHWSIMGAVTRPSNAPVPTQNSTLNSNQQKIGCFPFWCQPQGWFHGLRVWSFVEIDLLVFLRAHCRSLVLLYRDFWHADKTVSLLSITL